MVQEPEEEEEAFDPFSPRSVCTAPASSHVSSRDTDPIGQISNNGVEQTYIIPMDPRVVQNHIHIIHIYLGRALIHMGQIWCNTCNHRLREPNQTYGLKLHKGKPKVKIK